MGRKPKEPTCEEGFIWRGNEVKCCLTPDHEEDLHLYWFWKDGEINPTRLYWKTEEHTYTWELETTSTTSTN